MEMLDKQLEYASKWFEYHANQRISMFNYSLVAAGFLVSAYGTLVQKDLLLPAAAVCLVGIFVSLFAMLIDIRNGELVKLGEGVLRRLEREYLFAQVVEGTGQGIILLDDERASKTTGIRSLLKYSWLLRGTHGLVALGFLVLGIAAYWPASKSALPQVGGTPSRGVVEPTRPATTFPSVQPGPTQPRNISPGSTP